MYLYTTHFSSNNSFNSAATMMILLAEYRTGSRSIYLLNCLCSVGFVYSGYGYGSLTELTEVPGTGMEVLHNS